MSVKFEVVTEYKDKGINLPKRSTKYSAGYDIESAVDITIPSLYKLLKNNCNNDHAVVLENSKFRVGYSIDEIKKLVKRLELRVMVPTGLRVQLEPWMHLQLHMRSSIGTNCLLTLANGTGIIDADYYNADNEGHIHIPLINLSPVDINIKKGEKIAQGIIIPYFITDDDEANGERKGGFGSTDIDPHFGIPVELHNKEQESLKIQFSSICEEINNFKEVVETLQSNK